MPNPSDKDLKRLVHAADSCDDVEVELYRLAKNCCSDDEDDPNGYLAVVLARELLAARKVVRAANSLMRCTSFPEGVSDKWFACEVALLAALDAYDKARKGGG